MWQRIVLLALLFMVAFPSASHAEEKKETPLIACDQPHGVGEIFYDFDALIIYYAGFMDVSPTTDPEFPSVLKPKVFNDRLTSVLKKNLALCLKTADGTDKPIYTFFGDAPEDIECDEVSVFCRGSSVEQRKKMRDNPRNLTLMIRGYYFPQDKITPEVKGRGYILTYWYRPEVNYTLARLPFVNNSAVLDLPPVGGLVSMEEKLNILFDYLKPLYSAHSYVPAQVE